MKICILTSSFPRDKNDPDGIFIYQLAASLAKKGLGIEVLCPHDNGYAYIERRDDFGITRFPYFYPTKYQRLCYRSGILPNLKNSLLAKIQLPFFIGAQILSCLRWVNQRNPDIIHAHWSLPQGLTATLCGYISKIPCITSLHGSDIFGLQHPGLKWLNAMVIRSSDVCTANSQATAKMAEQISGRRNIAIVPMGVSPNFFRQVPGPDTTGVGSAGADACIVYAGRLIELKGVNYLVQAFPGVLKKYPEAKLIIVGSGPMKDDLVMLSNRLNLSNHVVFIDKLPQEKLVELYSSASLFVLPSIVNKKGETEGLGMVLLEAMACGLPVIGSNVGGIPDIIVDGETGLLARPKEPASLTEKITTLFSDRHLRQRLVENGRRFVKQNFAWDVIAEKFIGIYRSILGR